MATEMVVSWQEILDKLTYFSKLQGVLDSFKLKQQTAGFNSIKFCLENDLIFTSINNWRKIQCASPSITKSSRLANQYKNEGNKAYTAGRDDQALNFYSQGVICATQSELPILLGNRSAVLYRKNMFREAIHDIEMAITNCFPRNKIWKLYVRKGECLYHLKCFEDSLDTLELSLQYIQDEEHKFKVQELSRDITYKRNAVLRQNESDVGIKNRTKNGLEVDKKLAENGLEVDTNQTNKNGPEEINIYGGYNPMLPNASNCLNLQVNQVEGRHLVATSDMEVGSTIICETPYAAVLLAPWYDTHCQHCYQPVELPVPCKQCTEVRYCSDKCRSESWDRYHYFECGRLQLLEKIGIAHLSLRIILLTSKEELLKPRDSSTSKNFQEPYLNNYDNVYNLLTHSNDMETEDLFQYSLTATLLYEVLSYGKYFKFNSISAESRILIGELLLRHILQLVCNAHAITSFQYTSSLMATNVVEQDQVRIATAIYPTTSLLNHSCEPSIINCFRGDKLIVKLVKPVKLGEQVYNCYGPHFRRMDFKDRHEILKQQYFFLCKCVHCLQGCSIDEKFDCFCCLTCKSALDSTEVHCGRHEMHCDYCDIKVDVSSHEEKLSKSETFFLQGLQVLENNPSMPSILKSLGSFMQCKCEQEKILFRYHSKLAKTYDAIAKCHAMLSEYKNSIGYLKLSYVIVEKQYGSQSIEITNEILKMSDIYIELAKGSSDIESINEILIDGIDILRHGEELVRVNKEPNSNDEKELNEKIIFLRNIVNNK